MQEIRRVLGRYLFPALLVFLGLYLVIISGQQTNLFLFGGLGIMAVGIISALFVKGLISQTVQVILSVAIALIAFFFAYQDYAVIKEKLEYAEERKKVETSVKQRLKDIRKVQLAYVKEKGRYAASFDSLKYFLNNGQVSLIKRFGTRPDSIATDEQARELGLFQKMPEGMTEDQVLKAGILVRDTVLVPVKGYIFDEDDKKTRKTPLYLDSLAYVPFGNHKFDMRADVIDKGGVRAPVFYVVDPQPFGNQLSVGSLTDATTAGNWKE